MDKTFDRFIKVMKLMSNPIVQASGLLLTILEIILIGIIDFMFPSTMQLVSKILEEFGKISGVTDSTKVFYYTLIIFWQLNTFIVALIIDSNKAIDSNEASK